MDEQTSRPRPAIGGTRKHMGVATSDPTYLPPVDNPNAPASDRRARIPVRKVSYGRGGSAQNGIPSGQSPSRIPVTSPTMPVRTHEGGGHISPRRNYISTPKKGRAIFTSRQDRQRRRIKIALGIMIVSDRSVSRDMRFPLLDTMRGLTVEIIRARRHLLAHARNRHGFEMIPRPLSSHGEAPKARLAPCPLRRKADIITVLNLQFDEVFMDEQLPKTRAASSGTRKHMGVATSDPEYLPPVGGNRPQAHVPPTSPTLRVRTGDARGGLPPVGGNRPQAHVPPTSPTLRVRTGDARGGQAGTGAQPNYGRYISTPQKGRSIFTSRQDRQRRRVKILLGALIIAATALALFWLFVLR